MVYFSFDPAVEIELEKLFKLILDVGDIECRVFNVALSIVELLLKCQDIVVPFVPQNYG